MYPDDLPQTELRVLYERVGTLNVWVSINTPINREFHLTLFRVPVDEEGDTQKFHVNRNLNSYFQDTGEKTRPVGHESYNDYVHGQGYQVISEKMHSD